jgi:hypothetical protein
MTDAVTVGSIDAFDCVLARYADIVNALTHEKSISIIVDGTDMTMSIPRSLYARVAGMACDTADLVLLEREEAVRRLATGT